ncbi:MAG: hypothetical protein A3C06_01575 [Candidatus Taylorbacteria bacterium RIFCSPHIGHO2_02_FULL_46_13]|uniref:Type 4 fimbrial biogenesis protein PilX N-terminal domain-containing protein n=1 Tax=Candidatus Taylorbacteria bacterium RIFCSPHIGHO2_02_FULL_46_13 TaxID=1802312 RepID=A0A1G2MTJ4_9BACT|nr:MAG: hypothetical protein A3C06_01575 [Candidatus Taylorbacteria bacterium RIFCSPHIGHO2_02_FULL_46_13]
MFFHHYTLYPNSYILRVSRGFTLYYAILFGSLILSVGASMLNLSLKEFLLSSALRESEYAFFAADSGTECALYWDLHGWQSGSNTLKVFQVSSTADPTDVNYVAPENKNNITCDGTGGAGGVSAAVTDSGTDFAITRLTYNVNQTYCTVVEVAKRVSSLDGSISTTITARGYNTPGTGTGLAFCNTGNRLGKVERQFITYY